MKAVFHHHYGQLDVLRYDDFPEPRVGDDDILVRVHAAAVDPGVWHLMTGHPRLLRLLGYGLRAPRTKVRGRDVSGTVEAVGRDITRFRPGDEVYGTADGTFAEYTTTTENRLSPKPKSLTHPEAATVPVSGTTALQALRAGKLKQGDRVLILGAAGGVGTFALQLAKHSGAHVTAVCSTAKLDLAAQLGADEVLDHTREDPTRPKAPYDLVLDTAGHRPLRTLRRLLTPTGTLVIIGSETGGTWLGGVDRPLRATLWSLFLRQHLRGLVTTEHAADFTHLATLIDKGALTPALDRTFPLSEVPEAIDYVRQGRSRGKVAITI